jgi:hypothetical protein
MILNFKVLTCRRFIEAALAHFACFTQTLDLAPEIPAAAGFLLDFEGMSHCMLGSPRDPLT